MMKIVITGASGFIGTEVIHELLTCQDIDIMALTRKKDSTFTASQKVVWKQTDYSVDSLSCYFEGADVVIHLAAVRGTSGSIKDYHINESITENVLLAMHKKKVPKIIFASSIAVYSDTSAIPWSETNTLTPKTLYGISKASCEYLCMYYARKFGFHYIIFRLAQVLGEAETRPGMINTFIDQAYKKEKITVIGKSIAKRQYIYIKDLINIIREATFQEFNQSETINIGMDQAYSNLEIAQIVNYVFENNSPIIYQDDCAENIESSFMDTSLEKETLKILPGDMKTSMYDIRKRCYENISERRQENH